MLTKAAFVASKTQNNTEIKTLLKNYSISNVSIFQTVIIHLMDIYFCVCDGQNINQNYSNLPL